MTRFYELLTESNELVATVKHYSQLGDFEKARKLRDKDKRLYAVNKLLKRYQRKLSKIRKRMTAVYISKGSADWKRKEIDSLTRLRNKYTKKAYEVYGSRQ
jgi:DNA repair ATPase RecN